MKKEAIVRFRLEGMTCSACSSRIEKVLNALPEVETASVSLAASTATVVLTVNALSSLESPLKNGEKEKNDSLENKQEDFTKINKIIMERVDQIGFKAFPLSAQDNSQKVWENEQARLSLEMNNKKKRVLIEAIFSLPIMIIAMGAHMGMPLPSIISMYENPLNFAVIQLILLLPVLWSGREFYVRGIPNLLRGAPNMDSLVAIGTGSALLYSVWSTYEIFVAQSTVETHMAVMGIYYESVAILITLISFGKYLELRSKNKTQDAIKRLMDLSPKTVSLVADDGSYIEIAAEEIILGDRIFIRPGNQIPVDGIIVEGASSLDMSAITGEFMPVTVRMDDNVTSGSINIGGTFTMKAEHVGSDTVLARIITLVQEAQGSKAPIARLADSVSLYFVPAVMAMAVLSGLAWYYLGNAPFGEALKIFVAVMVVACPCALGLATPMSVMVATGRAAKLGLLIKNGTALELAGKIDTIVFDKTGTLTEGKPHLNLDYAFSVAEATLEQERDDFVMQLATSMEQNSEHPLAKAFMMGLQAKQANADSADSAENAKTVKSTKNDKINKGNSSTQTEEKTQALSSYISRTIYEFEEFEEVSGRGIRAVLVVKQSQGKESQIGDSFDDKEIRVPYCIGNMAFMKENNIILTDEEKLHLENIMKEGKSPLIVGQASSRGNNPEDNNSKELSSMEPNSTKLNPKSQAIAKKPSFTLEPLADIQARGHVCCGGSGHHKEGEQDAHGEHAPSTAQKTAQNTAPENVQDIAHKSMHMDAKNVHVQSTNKQSKSYTLPFFDTNAKVLAIFSVEDRIRKESAELIQSLKKMGIRPMLLSGDNAQSVYAVGKKVGIEKENCIAEVMPADKEAQIRHLQAQNQIVGMVGDGINDAPALAKADVGMVMGSGMDIAMEAGDLVLLRGIKGILSALRLSRATVSNIRLSLFWAFAYNILLLPVAAGLLVIFGGPSLSPMLAGAAMAFSSFSVVTNALRLRNFE